MASTAAPWNVRTNNPGIPSAKAFKGPPRRNINERAVEATFYNWSAAEKRRPVRRRRAGPLQADASCPEDVMDARLVYSPAGASTAHENGSVTYRN